jgi:hypothetical protein
MYDLGYSQVEFRVQSSRREKCINASGWQKSVSFVQPLHPRCCGGELHYLESRHGDDSAQWVNGASSTMAGSGIQRHWWT